MATSDRGTDVAREDELASRVHAAEFVTVSTCPTADAIVGTALLVDALTAQSIPFHARFGAPPTVSFATDVVTIAVGEPTNHDPDIHLPTPAADEAAAFARTLGTNPNPHLAAVGRCAWSQAGTTTEDESTDLERTPGLGLPVADVHEGIGHSTLIRGPWSGPDAGTGLPRGAANDASVASLVAMEALAATAVPERAARSIERVLGPIAMPDGPFETVAGFAEILELLAAVDPGVALALACEPEASPEAALERWRTYASHIHARLDDGPTENDGVAVYHDAGPAAHVLARLARTYEVEAARVIATTEDAIAIASTDSTVIDALLETPPAPIATWYRHGPRVARGTVETSPSAASTAVKEALG